jgi:peptide deformylase
MQILTLGSDQLRQKAEKIDKINEDTAQLTREMFDMVKKDKGIGLAAPQIGICKRLFVVHIEGDIERVFINPSILETSQETAKVEEGCLSIPGVYADVIRSESVKIQAWNEKGKPFTLEASGLLSRVIQHEYDHLEGILFLDRLPEDKKEKILAKYEKKAQKGVKAKK